MGMFSRFLERGEKKWLVFKGALNDLGNLSKRFDADTFSKPVLYVTLNTGSVRFSGNLGPLAHNLVPPF